MILIFDTYGGLCNQFYDIINSINFCLDYKINFTFRFCSFRNDNLITWYQEPFEKLFDTIFLNKYDLYINYHSIEHNICDDNCYNINGQKRSIDIFHDTTNMSVVFNQIINFKKEYVVLPQFWSVYKFRKIVEHNIYEKILPSKLLFEKYDDIKRQILKDSFKYNFLHYRYEHDFTNHFNLKVDKLENLIEKVNFKNKNIKTFIGGSNINKLIDKNDNLLFKSDELLNDLNYEEKAFIDYMFGLHSEEFYGHINSSFSGVINLLKKTRNFY